MNLLTDPWLPVKDQQGNTIEMTLAEIGAREGGVAADIIAPRADFKGAIYQLLIGVLQTAFAPQDRREWKDYWRNPPDRGQLQDAFRSIERAFNLDAENGTPAFMQDFDLPEDEDKPVSGLLIEAPGEQTLKLNADHFIKRGGVECLSPYWAAIALFTLQINAPSGGSGHRVSVRGGGPMTTLVLPPENTECSTLWHQLWLNVLTQEDLAELHGNHGLNEPAATFPWLAPTRTSEKKGMETYPEHAHPLQMYWSMPRRIRLNWEEGAGKCGLTGQPHSKQVRHYQTRNYGVNYAGNWQHPLTPYSLEADKEPLSIKGQPGGIGYRHWLGLAVNDDSGKAKKAPALVVQKYQQRWRSIGDASITPRLWAFGYDMDNMKARCWYEATMPLFNLQGEALADLQHYAQKMITAAVDVLGTLKSALKSAWIKDPKNEKKKERERKLFVSKKAVFIDANFWSTTEPSFYRLLAELAALVEKNDEEGVTKLLSVWGLELKQSARTLFDQYALSSLNEDGDYKQVIKAKHGKGGLEHYLSGSKALKALAA